ncbi:hypothetical protein MLD38_011924 [Melastoma candidum]|uniref:Uncharacterized protein n=1 Tax=Melastoma candidum TaxID=119954 RepID=A0ACB9R4N0_9MYRT|nr:hypothetical protein MLD38_011924 [Melastoma candidum]
MSFMKGDLPTRTRKLFKGLAKAEPIWLKSMGQSRITLPDDVYIKKFFNKYPESKSEDAIKHHYPTAQPIHCFQQTISKSHQTDQITHPTACITSS